MVPQTVGNFVCQQRVRADRLALLCSFAIKLVQDCGHLRRSIKLRAKHALKITAADCSAVSIATYQYTRHHIPVGRNPDTAVTSLSQEFFFQNYPHLKDIPHYRDSVRTAQ